MSSRPAAATAASRKAIISRNFQPVSTWSSGKGGRPGKNAFFARCSITVESFPTEYIMTGLRAVATTSRMMVIASDSRRFRLVGRELLDKALPDAGLAAKGLTRWELLTGR